MHTYVIIQYAFKNAYYVYKDVVQKFLKLVKDQDTLIEQ